ncbi:MAG: hypothetical protein WCQ48_02885, partial [Chloroflexota bacterium]
MDSSGARRVQLLLLALVGVAAVGAGVLLATGGTVDLSSVGLFGGGQTKQSTANASRAPARQADSVEAFSKKYGDPPDATAGRIRIPS